MNKLSVPTPEQVSDLRAKVAHRREYLKLLEMELFNTRALLEEFTNEYSLRIVPLENEQQRLEKLLAETVERRTAAHKGNGARRPGGKSTEGRERERGYRARRRRLPSSKNPGYERKIRELFRNLAKRFHPDLAPEPEEKKQREQIMARINQAYSARDLSALEALAKQGAHGSNGNAVGPEREIARLKVELRHLEAMIFEVEHTIRELDLSPAMQLRSEVNMERQAGRHPFSEMEEDLKARIETLREHLVDLGVEAQQLKA